jgi:polysaccharide biosynthesis protein PslG
MLEDYDKGDDLADVARDFALMQRLGVRTWRGSFGWDDYEPSAGTLDLDWLHRFADLASQYGITLRPYLGYTPAWAALGRKRDGQAWNDPPRHLEQWRSFVARLAAALERHRNVASLEIYNEENTTLWWDGTAQEYVDLFESAAAGLRQSASGLGLLPGGMVWPDADWLGELCEHDAVRTAVAIPFHAYPETWTPDSITVENYLDGSYSDDFLNVIDRCGHRPVWINEMGFATTPGKTEHQQADWWARAIATFLAEPRIEHIGIYELKDQRQDTPIIGDAPNYYLGLTRSDRTPKLAFFTVDLLTDLLDTGFITIADDEVTVQAPEAGMPRLFHHLFIRPDQDQVLLIWTRDDSVSVDLSLDRAAANAVAYGLDGTPSTLRLENHRTLRSFHLSPGTTRIVRFHSEPNPVQ